LLAWLDALAPLLERPDDAIARAREQSATLGRTVRVEFPGRELIGVAEDLTAEGALVVRDEAGVRHEVHAGDVVHLRPA
jgi:BirA family biotin operon repressor/biotin-[acetyl-CoA-carboxylase] ligase